MNNSKQIEQAIQEQFPNHDISNNVGQGQNNYCKSYKITDRATGRDFFMKVILLDKVTEIENIQQVFDELNAYSSCHSAYLTALIEYKRTDSYLFMKMPLLLGNDLRQLINSGHQFSENEIFDIAIALLRGLSDLNRHGVDAHQDIKPENIFMEENGGIKILDFGSIRLNKKSFKGQSKRNYAYSSPEMIKGASSVKLEELRLLIDQRVDIFSIGLILYELMFGRHPYMDHPKSPGDAIIEGAPLPIITRGDISPILIQIAKRMLDFNMHARPSLRTATEYFEQKNIHPTNLPKGEVYYHVTNGIKTFERLINGQYAIDGGVIEASQLSPNIKKRLSSLVSKTKTILVDPQIYSFQNKAPSKKFQYLPYSKYKDIFSNFEELIHRFESGDPVISQFIDDVISFQISAGVSAIIPPFVYIREFNDQSWRVDQELTNIALSDDKIAKYGKSLVKGIAISEEILNSEISRNRLLDYLTTQSDKLSAYYVLLESNHSEVIFDEAWLESAKLLFNSLRATGKPVIWAKADISGILLSRINVSVSLGENKTQRKFNIVEEKSGFGNKLPYYYIRDMYARAAWPDALLAFKTYDDYSKFVCNDICCKGISFDSLTERSLPDLEKHMVQQLSLQYKEFSKLHIDDAQKKLKDGTNHYDKLRNLSTLAEAAFNRNVKPGSKGFIESWIQSLGS